MRALRLLRAILRALARIPKIAFAVLLGFLRSLRRPDRERIVPEKKTGARAEWAVILLLLGAGAAGVTFFVLYAADVTSTQFLGLALGRLPGVDRGRPDRHRQAPDPHRAPGGVLSGRGAQRGGERHPGRAGERQRDHPAAPDRRCGRRCGGRPRALPDRTRRLAGSLSGHRVALSLALAAGPAAGRRPWPAVPGGRHRAGLLLHGVSGGRLRGGPRLPAGGGAARPQRPAPARGPRRLGAGGNPRLLEDLHPRGLRRRPLPEPAASRRPSPGPRWSVPVTTRPSTRPTAAA